MLDVRKYVCVYHLKLCRCVQYHLKRFKFNVLEYQVVVFLLKNSSVKNASSITSYIDIVNEETHDGMVFEEHTLSVNNCDYS